MPGALGREGHADSRLDMTDVSRLADRGAHGALLPRAVDGMTQHRG